MGVGYLTGFLSFSRRASGLRTTERAMWKGLHWKHWAKLAGIGKMMAASRFAQIVHNIRTMERWSA